ncbi:DUF2693 domain-containing protein [Aliiroseovarius sp. Z3]|uniref:hypothetical protein n=1 Tax=Aliiroseovarius sp. Z3 TaxID=2811402 RepID=UPI0023B30C47|nr:hypothetical protein [Aliiroseovarius sp. Z3]MDE9449993.1 DUF2693 domain-containing protein [Aliiroseovarius sp. Z3]
MTINRANIMTTAWTNTRELMDMLGYAPRQLRSVFRTELIKAWRAAKEVHALAQRSVASLKAEIIALENKTFQGHEGRERLTTLKAALVKAEARDAQRELDEKRNLIQAAKGRIVGVVFTKKDGTARTMRVQPAALKDHIKGDTASEAAQKATQTRRARHPHLMPVWDVDKAAVRSVNLATISRIATNGTIHTYA